MLVFCASKFDGEMLWTHPAMQRLPVAWLSQRATADERAHVVDSFRRGNCQILLCTDVAARGLNFPSVCTVFHLPDFRALDDWAD